MLLAEGKNVYFESGCRFCHNRRRQRTHLWWSPPDVCGIDNGGSDLNELKSGEFVNLGLKTQHGSATQIEAWMTVTGSSKNTVVNVGGSGNPNGRSTSPEFPGAVGTVVGASFTATYAPCTGLGLPEEIRENRKSRNTENPRRASPTRRPMGRKGHSDVFEDDCDCPVCVVLQRLAQFLFRRPRQSPR